MPTARQEVAFRYPLGDGRTQPVLTQSFGDGHCHDGECRNGHLGDDMRARTPLPTYVIGKGEVTYAANAGGGWGRVVIVKHEVYGWNKPLYSMYAHLSRIDVRVGHQLARGTQIGLTGTAPGSTAPHLHFELRTGSQAGTKLGRAYRGFKFSGDRMVYDGLTYLRPSSFIAQNISAR